jgi:hypothetical protein
MSLEKSRIVGLDAPGISLAKSQKQSWLMLEREIFNGVEAVLKQKNRVKCLNKQIEILCSHLIFFTQWSTNNNKPRGHCFLNTNKTLNSVNLS